MMMKGGKMSGKMSGGMMMMGKKNQMMKSMGGKNNMGMNMNGGKNSNAMKKGGFCPIRPMWTDIARQKFGYLADCSGGNNNMPAQKTDSQAIQDIQKAKNTPLNVGKYSGVNGFSQTKNGALVFNGKMDTDCDGAATCPKIDKTGQTSTSYTYQGKPIDALKANYVVLPKDLNGKVGNKYKLGDIVAVNYNGKTAFAIYGDNGPTGKAGEGSVHLTQQLGFDPYCGTRICKGIGSGVSYVVFPNSKGLYSSPYDNASLSAAGSKLLQQTAGN